MDSTTGTPPPPSEEQQQPTSSRRRGGGQKRKMTSVNSGNNSSSKRQGRERPPPVPFPQIYTNGPLTRARLNPTSSSSNNNYQVEVVAPVAKSEVEVQEAAKKAAEEMDRAIQDWEALEAKIDNEFLQVKMTAGTVHVVPVHAGWFLWKEIHPLEKKMMPSFFNEKSDKRNPEMYMEIRNWIMKKFHLDPSVNIELKHLSELMVGELDAKQEVMEFLDYWGLINYHPFPENEPVSMNVDTDADEALKPDSLVEKLFKFEAVQSWSPVIPRMSTAMPVRPSGLVPESSVVVEELVKSEGPSVEYHCNSCSADCSRKRYHCQKQADFDLCAECFNNGKFGSNMSPSDFILMEPPEAGGASGGNWTDQETILLLEAIELFRDNWSEIAEHVATKTKAQCILHFVQMPIEDTFFNDSENKATPEENGLPVSTNTEHSSTIVDQDKDVPVDDVSEQKKSANDNQMEVSKVDDLSESDNIHEVHDSVALKALKEAFESVGALPSSDGKLSFAEVGNPVMALAAFLVRLVEPNIATASVRTILKSLASNHSGSHLAARHCFCLEDPPNEEKKLDNLEGALIEENGPEVEEHVEKHDEQVQKENGDPCDSVIDRSSAKHDCNDKNKESASEEHEEKKDSPSEDQKAIVSNTGFSEKTNKITADGAQPTSMNVPSSSDIPNEETSKNAEESAVLESNSELQSDIMKEDRDLTEDHSQVKEPVKDEEMLSNSEEKEADALVVSNSATEKEKDTGRAKHESVNEKKESPANNDDVDSNKLQKVAMTALSAAAVKAKLLADHEEDQIRQLATFLIDKQLHKLEAKLGFFNDMETVASRVKEQLDRSKQRLFQERAQIIASRFGMSASARPNSQTVPTLNRASLAAMPNPNQGPRPFMGMNSMRPPISRPVMAPNLPSSNFVPATASGTLNQPSQ